MAGIPALKTSISRLKKKFLPFGSRKISIVRFDAFSGEVDYPSEENINEGGILLIPEVIEDDYEWERFNSIPSIEVPEIQGFDRESMTLEFETESNLKD